MYGKIPWPEKIEVLSSAKTLRLHISEEVCDKKELLSHDEKLAKIFARLSLVSIFFIYFWYYILFFKKENGNWKNYIFYGN